MKEEKRKRKKRREKEGEGFAEKRGRNVESTVFASESFVFSLVPRKTRTSVCVSPRWKSALLPYLARSPREGGDDTALVSFRNEIVENFILEETDPPNRIQRVAR